MLLNNFVSAYNIERKNFDTSKPYSLWQYAKINRKGDIYFLRNGISSIGLGAILFGSSLSSDILIKSDQAYIASLIVAKKYRGNGYSKRILDELEKIAILKGANSIRATIKPSNTPSVKAFTSKGYVVISKSKINSYINDDDDGLRFIVEKDLKNSFL